VSAPERTAETEAGTPIFDEVLAELGHGDTVEDTGERAGSAG